MASIFLLSALATVALFVLTWAVGMRIGDISIVDPVWGPGFVLVALIAAVVGDGDVARRVLLLVMVSAWGLRLGWHLTRRKLGDRTEDRRYAAIRERRGASFPLYSLVVVFGSQALLTLIVSLPVQAAATRDEPLGVAVLAGVALFLLGLSFEAIGDEQLRRFKSDPRNRGQVMDRGLWRYTRHPNYFGDTCVWWGLWLVAFVAAPGALWWTAVGPLAMTGFLVMGTGKKLLESDIGERRTGYADYVRRTSGFVPLPPR